MSDEIDRIVHFMTAPTFDSEDTTGINNTWQYRRAPDGYLFQLESISVSTGGSLVNNYGNFAMFDGHEYTHWNIWPGVQSNELIARMGFSDNVNHYFESLKGWECKEYTLAIRDESATDPFKICAIVWFHLKKATRMELMEYAIKHPKNEDMFKRVYRGTTVEPSEANG